MVVPPGGAARSSSSARGAATTSGATGGSPPTPASPPRSCICTCAPGPVSPPGTSSPTARSSVCGSPSWVGAGAAGCHRSRRPLARRGPPSAPLTGRSRSRAAPRSPASPRRAVSTSSSTACAIAASASWGGGVTVRLRGSCCVVSSGRSSCRQAAMARGWHDSLGDARLPAQTRSCHRPVGINVVVDFSVVAVSLKKKFDGIRRTERHRQDKRTHSDQREHTGDHPTERT